MPAEEYNAAVSGGLKLKGVNSSSKVSKTKKKKAKPESKTTDLKRLKDETLKPADDAEADDAIRKASFKKGVEDNDDSTERNEEAMLPPLQRAGKTEAELRHEERRRKRLDERLKREGTKTHKERVEELNRYLSNLSEHHDMPRIGPG